MTLRKMPKSCCEILKSDSPELHHVTTFSSSEAEKCSFYLLPHVLTKSLLVEKWITGRPTAASPPPSTFF